MSRIFWDTNLFIYLVEDSGEFSERVKGISRRMRERDDELFTSTLTLGELLVHPLRKGRLDLRNKYEELLERYASVVAFDTEAARTYAYIRKDREVRPPDAIQLACAASVQTDLFITNDRQLAQNRVPGIKFISPLADAPI